jgi:hypothetical protein
VSKLSEHAGIGDSRLLESWERGKIPKETGCILSVSWLSVDVHWAHPDVFRSLQGQKDDKYIVLIVDQFGGRGTHHTI